MKPTIIGTPNLWDKVASGFGSIASSAILSTLTGGGWAGAGIAGFTEASSEAQSVKEQLTPIVGEDEAAKRAMKSFGLNLGLVTVTERLGLHGRQASRLVKSLASVVMNDVQEAMQYDIERRQMWVPATDKNAEALLVSGWARQRGQDRQAICSARFWGSARGGLGRWGRGSGGDRLYQCAADS